MYNISCWQWLGPRSLNPWWELFGTILVQMLPNSKRKSPLPKNSSHLRCSECGAGAGKKKKKGLLLIDHDITNAYSAKIPTESWLPYTLEEGTNCCAHSCQKKHYVDFEKTKQLIIKVKWQKVPQAFLRFTVQVLVHLSSFGSALPKILL